MTNQNATASAATQSKKPVRSTPEGESTLLGEPRVWGALSKHIYDQAKRPMDVLDETPPPEAPYAQPHFTVGEYMGYRDQLDEISRSFFLLLVAFSLRSDGL